MHSSTKLILIVAVILGVVALSAGIAVAAGDTGRDEANPAVVSEGPGDDENGAEEKKDDDGSGGGEDSDESLTGETATKAADAARSVTGGGTVLTVEADDGSAGYEVEIRKTDGSEAEVELDKSFQVAQRADDD